MAKGELAPGISATVEKRVAAGDLASAYGNPGVAVLSSMTLMTLLEQACLACLAGRLPSEVISVGTHMAMDHLAPTPEGMVVTARAELGEVAGRRLVFAVEAHDSAERVATATHVRFVVDRNRFLTAAARKKAAQGESR